MAKLMLPHGWQLRGSSDGTKFSKGPYGQTLASRKSPKQPRSSFQQSVRANFGNLAQRWRGLTDSERAQWEGAAENFKQSDVFGQSFKYTGFNLFTWINRWRQEINAAITTTPPIPSAVTNSLITVADPDATGGTFEITFSPNVAANHSLIVYATPPLSAGKKFVSGLYKKIKVLPAATASPHNIIAAYQTRYGAIAGKQGMKIAVSVRTITNEGLPGIVSSASGIIV
jgi:hypothetical protein